VCVSDRAYRFDSGFRQKCEKYGGACQALQQQQSTTTHKTHKKQKMTFSRTGPVTWPTSGGRSSRAWAVGGCLGWWPRTRWSSVRFAGIVVVVVVVVVGCGGCCWLLWLLWLLLFFKKMCWGMMFLSPRVVTRSISQSPNPITRPSNQHHQAWMWASWTSPSTSASPPPCRA
jgi:hypothetical protein